MREVLIAAQPVRLVGATVFEHGLGLFGSPEDAALIDEVVFIAFEERGVRSQSHTCRFAE
jgi:hypothetical protein